MRCAGAESLRVAGSRKHGVTAERVADAVWNCYRGNRRQVVVPWSGNLADRAVSPASRRLQLGNAQDAAQDGSRREDR